jgi:hypothetical protein
VLLLLLPDNLSPEQGMRKAVRHSQQDLDCLS